MLIPTNESGSDHSQVDLTKNTLFKNNSEYADPNQYNGDWNLSQLSRFNEEKTICE